MVKALMRIAHGKYDGLEASHYTAKEARQIAAASLKAKDASGDG